MGKASAGAASKARRDAPLGTMKYKLFACEILFREICSLAAVSPNIIDVEFLTKGLHDIGRAGMSSRLAERIAAVDESEYDAILLGYALCSGGVVGLSTKTIPLVIPRAHDCITLFLGDKKRYEEYFFANAGTYFKTTGWIERGANLTQDLPDSVSEKLGLNMSMRQMIEKYGEDNATFLRDQITKMQFYTKYAFIETGVEPDDSFERQTREQAAERGWKFEKLVGDLSLLRRLLNGPWNDDDFLVVDPGKRIEFSYDGDIMRAV